MEIGQNCLKTINLVSSGSGWENLVCATCCLSGLKVYYKSKLALKKVLRGLTSQLRSKSQSSGGRSTRHLEGWSHHFLCFQGLMPHLFMAFDCLSWVFLTVSLCKFLEWKRDVSLSEQILDQNVKFLVILIPFRYEFYHWQELLCWAPLLLVWNGCASLLWLTASQRAAEVYVDCH